MRPGGMVAELVGVGPSSRTTASSFSPIELDLASLDGARATLANFEKLPPEPEVEPELDFFSIGGGRMGVLDRFSFELELPFVPTESGLISVGVSELGSTSFGLGEQSDSVGEVGACEAEVEERVRERAAL